MTRVSSVRGRPGKPTALKIRDGHQKSKLPKNEPKPKRGIPPMPAFLDERTGKTWNELSAILDRMGVLTVADEMSLKLLCELYTDYCAARKEVRDEGMFYTTINQSGGELVRVHPAMGVLSDCDRRLRQWLVEFGLTPSSRSRVTATDAKDNAEEDLAQSYFN